MSGSGTCTACAPGEGSGIEPLVSDLLILWQTVKDYFGIFLSRTQIYIYLNVMQLLNVYFASDLLTLHFLLEYFFFFFLDEQH